MRSSQTPKNNSPGSYGDFPCPLGRSKSRSRWRKLECVLIERSMASNTDRNVVATLSRGVGSSLPPSDHRNPDGDVQPWCYVPETEEGIYWRYCDIPTCHSK